MKIKCIKCGKKFSFSKKWRGNPKNYICRTCKIKATTKSSQFKSKQSEISKRILSDPLIKRKMSNKAIINNIKNSDKISKSLKQHFYNPKAKEAVRASTKKLWEGKEFKNKISNSMKKRWKDPEYRGKIFGSRVRLKKKQIAIAKILNSLKLSYEPNYILTLYEFDFFIENKILFDEKYSEEKDLFIKHYFPKLKYTNDLAVVEKLGN
jgi:hypothetical protein